MVILLVMTKGLSSYEAANGLNTKLMKAEKEIERLKGVVKRLQKKLEQRDRENEPSEMVKQMAWNIEAREKGF
jgi:hypothetical protein